MTPTVAFDEPGKHHGHLMLPHSRDDSAWGHVMIPICVIQGGEGPTALITGGNHGDEYEGPIAIHDLAATLDAAEVTGRIILIPQLNQPAVLAGRRCSPIDGGNLNRAFPGDARDTATRKIAAYIADTLIPMADLVLDFHSGGRTLDFLPFAASHILGDAGQDARCAAAARAFAAPYTMRMREIDDAGMLDGVAERAGKTFVTTELGGAGMARAGTVAVAKRGLRNVLIHGGLLDETPDVAQTRTLEMPEGTAFVFAGTHGLFEPLVDLGAEVAQGQPLARIWPVHATGGTPQVLSARTGGLFVGRHAPGLIQPGDCACVVGIVLD